MPDQLPVRPMSPPSGGGGRGSEALFKRIDRNGNGLVARTEFRDALESDPRLAHDLGIAADVAAAAKAAGEGGRAKGLASPARKVADEVFDRMNTSGHAKISPDEFHEWWQHNVSQKPPHEEDDDLDGYL